MDTKDNKTISHECPQSIFSKKGVLYLGLILLITFLSFSPTLKNDFVSNDDNLHIYDNPTIRVLDTAHIKEIFTKLFNPTYVPLTILSFAFEYHFVKYDPFLYHLNNLLLHLAVTVLIFYFAYQIGLPLRAAFIAGLLFGIHPMHVESVAWVTERKDVLYSFFYMLAICCYWKYLSKPNSKMYAATIIFGLLSILSKPMALSLPLVMFICDWYKNRKYDKWMILDKIPHFLYIIPIALVTYLVNARNPIEHGGEAILLWVWCLIFYFYKFLLPIDLVIFYRFPQPFSLATPEFALYFATFILLIISLWYFRRKKLFIFSITFYFFSIFFLLRFDDILYLPPVSNRFLYLPSLGFCFLIGYGIDQFFRKNSHQSIIFKNSVAVTLILIIILLAGKSFIQTQTWRSSISFWSHELKYYPDNAMALVNRGEAYKDIGEVGLAFADFNKSIAVNSVYAEAYNSRGQLYALQGNLDAALEDFQKTIEMKPHFDEAYNNLGIIYAMKKETKKSVIYFNKALEIDPFNVEAHYNLGDFYYQQGNLPEALEHMKKVLEINPNSASGYNKRGLILGIQQHFDLALRDFNQSIEINPHNSEAYTNRGIVFEQKKMFQQALESYNTALKINPQNADAYYGRGNVYANLNMHQHAAQEFIWALKINPEHKGAQQNQKLLNQMMFRTKIREERPLNP